MNRHWLSCVTAACLVCFARLSAAAALVADIAPDDARQLRFEAVQALADVQIALDAITLPADTLANIYIGQSASSRWLIQSVYFTADTAESTQLQLSPISAAGLAEQSELRRIARLSLAPGEHLFHVAFTVADQQQPAAAATIVPADLPFEKVPGEMDLEILLDGSVISAPEIKTRPLVRDDRPSATFLGVALNSLPLFRSAPRSYRSGSEYDPALRHARNLERAGEHTAALLALLSLAGTAGAEAPLSAEYWLEMIRMERNLGMLDRAEAVCDQLDQDHEARSAVAAERLHLAESRNAEGDLDAAERQLQLATAELPETLRPDWKELHAKISLARERPAEAVAAFGNFDQTLEANRFIDQGTDGLQSSAYARFNLAVALIKNGEEKRGLSWLDLIGRSKASDPELLVLRDKANLALGWHFLQAKQGRTAMGVLGRIRSKGLSSNRALLGMGWAELAPNGKRLPREALDLSGGRLSKPADLQAPPKSSLLRLHALEQELNGGLGPANFERDDPPKTRTEGLHKALAIWTVLAARDEREPAVLEALLAIAYAQDQLRDQAEARAAYSSAIAALRRVQSDIMSGESYIAGGGLSGAVVDAPENVTVFELMNRLSLSPDEATTPIYLLLEEQQSWQRLGDSLRQSHERLVAVGESLNADERGVLPDAGRLAALMTKISGQQARATWQAEQLAMRALDDRAVAVRGYLRSALFLAARIEDEPLLDGRGSVSCGVECH